MSFRYDVLMTILFRGVSTLGSLVVGIITARWLLPEGRGILATLLTTNDLAVAFASLGVVQGTGYLIAVHRDKTSQLLSVCILHSVIAGVFSICAGLVALRYLPTFFTGVSPWMLVVSMAAVPGMLFLGHGQSAYLGLKQMTNYNLIELLLRFAIFLLTVIVLVYFRKGLVTYVSSCSAIQIFLALGLGIVLIRGNGISMIKEAGLLWSVGGTGFRAYLVNWFSFLAMQIDIYMINHFLGSAENGYYAVALQLARPILMIALVVGAVVFSWVANRACNDRLVLKSALFTAGLSLALIVPLMLWGNPIVRMMFGSEFMPSVTPLQVLLPGMFFLSFHTVLAHRLAGQGYPIFLAGTWLVSLVFKTGLCLYLIPSYGIAGAALSSTAAYILQTAVVFVHFVIGFRRLEA